MRRSGLAVAVLSFVLATPAWSQEDLEIAPGAVEADVPSLIRIECPNAEFSEDSVCSLSSGTFLTWTVESPTQISGIVVPEGEPDQEVLVTVETPEGEEEPPTGKIVILPACPPGVSTIEDLIVTGVTWDAVAPGPDGRPFGFTKNVPIPIESADYSITGRVDSSVPTEYHVKAMWFTPTGIEGVEADTTGGGSFQVTLTGLAFGPTGVVFAVEQPQQGGGNCTGCLGLWAVDRVEIPPPPPPQQWTPYIVGPDGQTTESEVPTANAPVTPASDSSSIDSLIAKAWWACPCNDGCGRTSGCESGSTVSSGETTSWDVMNGAPVNFGNLDFYLNHTFLEIPSRGFPLQITARYRSRIDYQSRLGFGWELNLWARLVQDGPDLIFYNGLARGDRYVAEPDGRFASPAGRYDVLVRDPEGTYTLRWPNGFRYRFHGFEGGPDGGQLQAMIDTHGNRQELAYDAEGRLSRVLDTMGRPVDILYDERGFLNKLVDFAGREILLTQDENGDLVAIASPVVVPAQSTSPERKVWKFDYSSGFDDPRLNHNLLAAVAPQEVFRASEMPSLVNRYDADDRITQQFVGGTNETGIPAGGWMTFARRENPDGSFTTVFTDANGNVTDFDIEAGRIVAKREYTRGLRPGDPDFFETRWEYDSEGRLTAIQAPEGNRVEMLYDVANPSRFSRNNLLEVRAIPDADRGGDQAVLVVKYEYEILHNKVRRVTSARGNDPSYVPQNGGPNSPGRYTTTYTYAYQEAVNAAAAMGGLDVATEAERFGIPLSLLETGLGDVNGDGRLEPNTACLIGVDAPTAHLSPFGRQKDVEGGLEQIARVRMITNEMHQLVKTVDPEGNVTRLEYYPESDPDGDGRDVRAERDNQIGGFLRRVIVDAESSPGRRSLRPPEAIATEFEWTPVGNLARVIDGRGIASSFVFDSTNQLVQAFRADDVSRANSNPKEPGGLVAYAYWVKIEYDANGRPVGIFEENRHSNTAGIGDEAETRILYDILGRPIQVEREIGGGPFQVSRIEYDANGNAVLFVSPEAVKGNQPGNVVRRAFDERDLPLSITLGTDPALASTIAYFYDANGNPVRVRDAQDHNGDGLPEETRLVLDGFDRVKETIDAAGNRSRRVYDPDGRLLDVQIFGHPAGATPLNDSGSTNVLFASSHFRYDELGRAFQVDQDLFVDPATGTLLQRAPELAEGSLTPTGNQLSALVEYDRNSRRTFLTTDDLAVYARQYDGVNRLAKTLDPLQNTVEVFYNQNSSPVKVVETERTPDGRLTETFVWLAVWDSLDRLVRTTDPIGQTRRIEYDSRDLVTSYSDAEGPLQADPLGLFSGTINGDGNDGALFYDGLGRLVEKRSFLRVNGQGGQPLELTNPANPDGIVSVKTVWDENSRIVAQVDDSGNRTSYEHDELNRLVLERFADGTTETFVYDRDHNLRGTTDANGTVRRTTVDALNRVLEIAYQRGPGILGTTKQTFQWDGLSRLRQATDDNDPDDPLDDSVVGLHYDSAQRLIEETQNGLAVSYGYLSNDLTSVRYPDGRRLDYGPLDALDRIQNLVFDGRTIAQYSYIGPWRTLENKYGNGTKLTYLDAAGDQVGYDGLRRITSHRYVRTTTDSKKGKKEEVIAGFEYTFNRENMIASGTRTHEKGRAFRVKYDSLYRITSFDNEVTKGGSTSVLSQQWTFDGVGNWKKFVNGLETVESTVNEMNEYVSFGGVPQAHDENGNRTSDGQRSYHWSAKNELVEVRNSKSGLVARYSYDAFGRRFRKFVAKDRLQELDPDDQAGDSEPGPGGTPGRVTFYLYAGWREVEERNGKGAVLSQYVDGRGIDEHLAMVSYGGKGRAPTSREQGRILFFYQDRHPNNVVQLRDDKGEFVDGCDYDAYGNVTYLNKEGKPRAKPAFKDNPYLFHGRRADPESGLLYFRLRYFDPGQGRWVSRDPIGLWGDSSNLGNGYSFAGGDPVNGLDPLGLGYWQMKFWSGGDYVWVPDSSGAGPDADDYGWQEVRHWNGRWGRRYVPGGPLKAGASRKKKPVNLQAIQMINWKETKTVILVGTAITTLPVTTVIAAQTGPGGVIAVAVGRSVPLIGPVLVEGGAATEGAGAAATEAGILAGEGAAESAAATEAAAALRSTNVALGLSREAALDAFASETNAVASGGWLRAGLIGDATSTSAFPQAFRQATSNAIASGGKIRFNLQGLNLGRALSAGWSDAALYCEETGYTEWELQQILRDKALFDNTEFYMGAGRLLTQSELEALGIVFLGG